MALTSRILAYFGFSGTVLDVMGGLYMGYDLLGGRNGPLALLTRAATYSTLVGICYFVTLGPHFGIMAGLGVGLILALEFHRVSRFQRLYKSSPLRQTPWFALARGLVFGTAAAVTFGIQFGILFGIFVALGLYINSRLGLNPTNDYIAQAHFRFTRHMLLASLARALAIGLAGVGAAWLETRNSYSLEFGLLVGGTVGLVSIILGVISPRIEWWIDNMPDRHMLLMGLGMIFCGFMLQSIQYLTVILSIQSR